VRLIQSRSKQGLVIMEITVEVNRGTKAM